MGSDKWTPDGNITPDLIDQAGFIRALTAEKVYDQIDVYRVAADRRSTDVKLLVSLRTDAVISVSNEATLRLIYAHVESIR